MDLGIKDKVAVVTAASGGLGRAAAEELAREGATVVAVSRNSDRLSATVAKIREATGAQVEPIVANCSDGEAIASMVKETEGRFGRIDILVNISPGPPTAPFQALSDEDWHNAVDVKVIALIRCARAVFPGMVRQKWGRIISIAGTHGLQPHAYAMTAGVANAAIINFSKALAEEGAPNNVLCNVINPGPIETERMRYLVNLKASTDRSSETKAKSELVAETLLKRFGEPREVAAAIAFLASNCASYITGTTLQIDGGQVKGI